MKLNNLIKRAFIAITMMLAVSVAASAHDFEAKNSDGATIYYNVNLSTDKTCEVTYQGNFSSEYSNEYTGNIIIPESVTYSGITYSVTSIGDNAFDGCSGLTSVVIPNSVTSIGEYAFYGCSGLTSVTIPNSVTSIGYLAFGGCRGLTSVTIPNSVTSIGYCAFEGCSGLTSVTIPEGVTSIGSCAFKGCSGLTSVTIPDGVTSIGYSAFSGCSGLISVTIPNSVTSIGDYAFEGCSGLTSVTIPNSVTSIGEIAFSGCSGLTSVTIPNSVTSIGYLAFGGCSGLESIIVESGNAVYDSRNNCNAIIETTTNILIAGCKNSTIPNSVTSIGGAFAGCTGLTSVVIPNSVTSIGYCAFEGCSGLTSVTIPEGVTSIGSCAFEGCSGLTSVVIPNSVTNICDHAFSRCSSLTSITIGNSVKEIGYEAFGYCTSLTSITSLNLFPPYVPHVFSSLPESVILYVPAESIEYYKLVEDWKFFSNIEALTIPAENITLDKNNISIKVSETTTLNITVLPENTTNKEVVWTSSDESVATVENGVVTAHKVGVATITATTTDGTNLSATCEVIVTPTVAENIALDKTSVSLEINETVALNITILPETTTNKEVVWTSSDESVATVENGIVTALKAGVATITATTTDGTNLSASCEVTVTPTIAESISLDKTSVSLGINETATLNITVLPENTTNKEVVWTSSDESVATVENGVVTALKVGVVTITATTTDGTNLSASCEVTVKSNGCELVAENIKTLHDRVVELPVYLVNDSEISAFQFDVYLPEGITIAIDEDEEYGMTLSADRATSSHTVSTFKQSNGAIRYACYSTKSAAFKGESGTLLFTIPLTIAKDIEGEFNVQIKDIILSSPSALGYNNPDMNIVVTVEKYELGDSNGDGIINVLDVVTTVNATLGIPSENIITDAADVNGDGVINVLDIVATVNLVLNQTVNTQLNIKNIMRAQVLTEAQARDNIFINDFTINASESKTIEVNMNNVDTYCAFQFDMYLPEGLTIDEEDEEFLIEATSRLTKSHMISTNKLSENVIRFVVYSNKNTNIKLNEGAIMTIPFTASAEMAAGSYQIEIKDVILSYNTGTGVNASNTITEVEVLSSTVTEIEEIVEDSSDIEYYNIQGIKVVNPSSGLYIKKQENKVTKVIL